MSVTAPPRPPSDREPVDRDELEALVEALIEEARQRQRRRRRRYAAVVTLILLVGVALSAMLGRGAQSQTASQRLAARSTLVAAAASSKIAFISEPPNVGYCGVVHVMNPDGSGQRRLFTGGTPVCDQEHAPAWSPDGRRIAIVNNSTIHVMNADGSGERRLTRDVQTEGSPAWSPDGRKIAFATLRDSTLWLAVANADGSGQRMLGRTSAANIAPAWSPDGRKLAFVGRIDRLAWPPPEPYPAGRHNFEIYVINADGSGLRRLTRNTVADTSPVWSPDGRRIAFESDWQVWVMNADGSGQRRLTHNGARNFAPAWSPNGQKIAFERRGGREKYGSCNACGRASSFQVWVMNADGSEARMLAPDGSQPSWAADGRRIAFARQSDIYVMNADGSEQRNLTRGAGRRESQPVWSPSVR